MTARLDEIGGLDGDRSGGVSDPRLVRRLGVIPPIKPSEKASVKRLIDGAFPEPDLAFIRGELESMLLDEAAFDEAA